jgi:GTP-binding protein EngB required for normal cell division
LVTTTPTWNTATTLRITQTPVVEGLPMLLDQTIERIGDLGPDFVNDYAKLNALRERLAEERFHLAVLGQFKRGKSTLLNALLGEALLPTSIVPLTAIPTFLRVGSALQARVTYQNDHQPETFLGQQVEDLAAFLARFVTEEGNPHNHLAVAHVEVFHNAPILRQGVVLIDTPGIGSTFRHNTEATLNFLPQCDAALFLVSADPPVTEVEVAFLKEVRAKVARIFFILNKVDYLGDEERQTALNFFRKVLQEQVGLTGDIPIFCISARQGLLARQTGDARLWTQSGLAEVENHLLNFLVSEKSQALQVALAKKAYDLTAEVLMRLYLTIRSLQMPLTELAERSHLFEQKLVEAGQQRLTATDLLTGDHKRTVAYLEEQAEQLRQKARNYLGGIVQETAAKAGQAEHEERVIQDALAEAIPYFFEHELGEMSRAFDRRVTEVLQPHQRRADELIETVRRSAAELFDIPYHAPDSTRAFVLSREPYWVTHQWSASLSPISPKFVDRLLPLNVRQTRVVKRLLNQVEMLVIRNVENLRWATLQSLDQTFRRFGLTLDERLQDTMAATRGAIQAACSRRQEQAEKVAEIVGQLESAVRELEQIQKQLEALFKSS